MEQRQQEVVQRYAAPAIMTPLKNVNVNEGERAHFEAKVGPVGDPSMVVEWYYNGTIITASKLFIYLHNSIQLIFSKVFSKFFQNFLTFFSSIFSIS